MVSKNYQLTQIAKKFGTNLVLIIKIIPKLPDVCS